MVFALYGAFDMATVLSSAPVRHVFDIRVDTLAANIGNYDSSNRNCCNQAIPPGLASRLDNGLRVQLPAELSRITGRDVFRVYSERFAAYAANPPPGVAK